MMKARFLLFFLYFLPLYGNEPLSEWTWIYHKKCNYKERILHKNKKSLLFCQENVTPFTQLIFSWNAIRPENGYFSFYVQVRDAATKKWGIWHHMVDWGSHMQQSYISKSDGCSSFVHVRLEIENKKSADAFRIKVQGQKAASLSLIHNLSVAASDYVLFKAESSKDVNNDLGSVYLSGVPKIAQFVLDHEDKGRICSPVSCAMFVNYIMNKDEDPLLFAIHSFDQGLGVYGSWPCNIAHAFEHTNGTIHFFVRRMNFFADIHRQLICGMPVVVSVRGSLPGAFKSFPHGHLLVVVGWDNETREVLCHDPAAECDNDVFKRYPLQDFLRAWESSHRLSYVAESK